MRPTTAAPPCRHGAAGAKATVPATGARGGPVFSLLALTCIGALACGPTEEPAGPSTQSQGPSADELASLPTMKAPSDFMMLDTGLSTKELQEQWHSTPEGSDVFPVALFQALKDPETGEPLIESFGRMGFVTVSDQVGALPVGFSRVLRPSEAFVMTGFNCAACHSTQIEYEGQLLHIDGGTSLLDIQRFFEVTQAALVQALGSGPDELATFLRDFVRYDRIALELLAAKSKKQGHDAVDAKVEEVRNTSIIERTTRALAYLKQKVQTVQRITESFEHQTEAGPGRADSFGIIRNLAMVEDVVGKDNFRPMTAPVSIPHLFDYGSFVNLHWDGNTTMVTARNFAQAVALGAFFDPETFDSSCRPNSIHTVAEVAAQLKPPAWPEEVFGALDQDKIARGADLFGKHCASCHTSSTWVPLEVIGTDPNRLVNYNRKIHTSEGRRSYASRLDWFSKKLMARSFEQHDVPQEVREEMEQTRDGAEPVWIETLDKGYHTRQLRGLWATAPFLHNGSVPTLWDLLRPAHRRPDHFEIGHREFDPVHVGYKAIEPGKKSETWTFDTSVSGNSKHGHEYGVRLPEDDRWALIEYLKTL